MKVFTKLAALAVVVAMGLAAFGGQAQAATSDSFKQGLIVYSVADARAIIVTPGAFQVQYADGNYSDVYSDPSGAQFNNLKAGAPALKTLVQVGSSGVWIIPEQMRKIQCQAGTGTPESPASYGAYIYILWQHGGYSVLSDPGCGTYALIKAASN